MAKAGLIDKLGTALASRLPRDLGLEPPWDSKRKKASAIFSLSGSSQALPVGYAPTVHENFGFLSLF